MTDHELYLKAIKDLPNDWIDDGTQIVIATTGVIIGANPNFPAMIYNGEKWTLIKFSSKPYEFRARIHEDTMKELNKC
jgi:hypothetical protein